MPDSREPSRAVTTMTTTTFSMTRDTAKAMCQNFMDARLIENAADPSSNRFKDRGIYTLTPKGLHVLDGFIHKNGINPDHIQRVFRTQPICIKLLHLGRRSVDDEIIVTQTMITALFRRFVGRQPNHPPAQTGKPVDAFQLCHERSKGIGLTEVVDRTNITGGGNQSHKHCFAAVSALEWLCNFTSIVGREEAAEMAAQFVRFGLITLVSDNSKNDASAIICTVRGDTPGGSPPVTAVGEFQCATKVIYRITDEGCRLARWESIYHDSSSPSTTNLPISRSSINDPKADAQIGRDISIVDRLNVRYDEGKGTSNTDRLHRIIDEPSLRVLFHDFLKNSLGEENLLSFWLAVQDLKRKFTRTSSADSAQNFARAGQKAAPGQIAMERHHNMLITITSIIYNTYLAPSSQCELYIDQGLKNELNKYLEQVMATLNDKAWQGRMDVDQAQQLNVAQLQTMIKLFERIQTLVFRLMAIDSAPKFIKTAKFKNWVGDHGPTDADIISTGLSAPPGLSEDTGGAYMTVSQHTQERKRHETPPLIP